jgi:homoaconitase
VSKSFARIHETNLKKQGVVPLTFANREDYDRIDACDIVDTVGLYDVLQAGGQGEIQLRVTKKKTGESFLVPVQHTLSKDQSAFILAGSALNLLAKKANAGAQ